MNASTYIEHGKFALVDKPKPSLIDLQDAVVQAHCWAYSVIFAL
jgi:hypothetical protein